MPISGDIGVFVMACETMTPARRLLLRRISLFGLSILFLTAGVFHFARPAGFVAIVPPFLPWPLAIVYVSGVFELMGGLGLLWPPTRRLAAWGLVALLVAVFPANIYHAVANVAMDGQPAPLIYHVIRLPAQALLIYWAWANTRPWPSATRAL